MSKIWWWLDSYGGMLLAVCFGAIGVSIGAAVAVALWIAVLDML